jgi:NTP pyrophosphatase (non-canonical NTP hydrolase)
MSKGISEEVAIFALEVHERRASPKVGPAGSDEDIRFLALSMAGEAGEAANVVKKAWRDGKPLDREALAEEIAGTACYLIGLAAAIGLDLDDEMRWQMMAFEQRYEPNSSGVRK